MTRNDYGVLLDGIETRHRMVDKLFSELAVHGDNISKGIRVQEEVLDRAIGDLSQVSSLILSDCVTLHNLLQVLVNEETLPLVGDDQTAVIRHMGPIVEYVTTYPLFPTMFAFLENQLPNGELFRLMDKAPTISVEFSPKASLDGPEGLALMGTIKQLVETRVGDYDFKISDISKLPERLFENTYSTLGVSTEMPEMVMTRFIAHHVCVLTSLLNTTLVFKASA